MIAIREPYYDAIIPVRDREGVFVESIAAAASAVAGPPPWPFGLRAALGCAETSVSAVHRRVSTYEAATIDLSHS